MPTFDECLAEAYAIHVRAWYDAHPVVLDLAEVA